MNRKVRWGILSTAGIAVNKVVPAMQQGDWSEVSAIASRDIAKATQVAQRLGIPKAYGSYEELLAGAEIEAIYNPLPNHLHVPWTTKAAEAGKHVLCEKPIALNMEEAQQLLAVRDRTGVKIQEAFMVRTHPQWLATFALIKSGRIGALRAINGFFSYFNRDPQNIRNKLEIGGGALLDIGCYPITVSRFIFGAEPRRVLGLIERDPENGHRSAYVRAARLSCGAGQLHLRHPIGSVPAYADLRHARSNRSRDSLQRAPRPTHANLYS